MDWRLARATRQARVLNILVREQERASNGEFGSGGGGGGGAVSAGQVRSDLQSAGLSAPAGSKPEMTHDGQQVIRGSSPEGVSVKSPAGTGDVDVHATPGVRAATESALKSAGYSLKQFGPGKWTVTK